MKKTFYLFCSYTSGIGLFYVHAQMKKIFKLLFYLKYNQSYQKNVEKLTNMNIVT